ncbi:ketose-bisphosphate aldolase [Salinicoccus hispanicus]|uniref:Ketose-bisphosphate aldolase n=2 Tax=Salinicoccus hispanicus TaxID=157225 RepID=A0A6N8U567_9STAP|nr:ketose-bisphosphate aldolase [Salinicoccus hispanicus]
MMENLNTLFNKYDNKKAIGSFNVHCLEMLPSMLLGAKEIESPIIIQTSLGTAKYIGFDLLVSTMDTLANRYQIDACLHLDHCTDMNAVKEAVDAGYTSVMYDGSSLTLEENISNTREIVEYAHKRNVSVEGEVGSIGGAEDGLIIDEEQAKYTDIDEAIRFVEETQVDALAVAIGTTHGQFKSKAKINYELLSSLSENLDKVGLVLHGGTGVSDEDMRKCVREGMKKINVGSELNKSYIELVNETFPPALDAPLTSLRKLLNPANDKIKEIVKEKSLLFQL